jgi:hypothetical protein
VGYAAESCVVIRSALRGLPRLESSVGGYANRGFPKPAFLNAATPAQHPTGSGEFFLPGAEGGDDSQSTWPWWGSLARSDCALQGRGPPGLQEMTVDMVRRTPGQAAVYVERMRPRIRRPRLRVSGRIPASAGRPILVLHPVADSAYGRTGPGRADELRKSVTFGPTCSPSCGGRAILPSLPRDRESPGHPDLPGRAALNGWDAKSVKGYYTGWP